MKRILLIATVIYLIIGCNTQSDFKFLGQTPPGDSAILFAPGLISLENRNESMITFSPDGKECYFTQHHKAWNWCLVKKVAFNGETWDTLGKASFSNHYTMCPSISSDGKQIFFASGRDSAMSVFQCLKTEQGNWTEPVKLDNEVNSDSYEYSCHLSNLGTMYVCSWRSGGVGGCDGWRIPSKNGKFGKAENLGTLNSTVGDCIWAPGPNEEFLVFQSRRPVTGNAGGFFETDLFITFALPDGSWSEPQNLGPKINSSATDGFAWVSHDGKYLFFSSDRKGSFDIFWVSLDSVLKNTTRKPIIVENQNTEITFYQKYKNASDKQTTLYFDLKKPGNTKLIIYDRAGNKLKTILNEYRQAGENNFIWKDEEIANGEYLCKLQLTDQNTQKLIMESIIQVLLR